MASDLSMGQSSHRTSPKSSGYQLLLVMIAWKIKDLTAIIFLRFSTGSCVELIGKKQPNFRRRDPFLGFPILTQQTSTRSCSICSIENCLLLLVIELLMCCVINGPFALDPNSPAEAVANIMPFIFIANQVVNT